MENEKKGNWIKKNGRLKVSNPFIHNCFKEFNYKKTTVIVNWFWYTLNQNEAAN